MKFFAFTVSSCLVIEQLAAYKLKQEHKSFAQLYTKDEKPVSNAELDSEVDSENIFVDMLSMLTGCGRSHCDDSCTFVDYLLGNCQARPRSCGG